MSSHRRRLIALEERLPKFRGRWHCLQWWPGTSWDEVLARHGNSDSIRPGDHVALIKFVAADGAGGAMPDPIMERDQPVARAWMAERGVANA